MFARDGITQVPLAPIWQKIPLDRRQVLFEGAKSEVIYFKDFICPITAKNAGGRHHRAPVRQAGHGLVDLVVKRGLVGDDTNERLNAAQKMLSLVKALDSNSAFKAAVNQQNRPNDQFASTPNVETGGPVASSSNSISGTTRTATEWRRTSC